jgi:rhamnulokinase
VRIVEVALAGGRLTANTLASFPTPWYHDGEFERWNLRSMVEGIREALAAAGEYDSWSVDTWGVDFGLIDDAGEPLGDPIRYRDPSHQMGADELNRLLPRERRYAVTGIQPLVFNTASQLMARVIRKDQELLRASRLLFLPDLLHYLVAGGEVMLERTIASTSEMLGLDGEWSNEIVSLLGIQRLLGPLCEAGERGTARAPGHDTAAAVVAAPGEGEGWAYISSGTWSLVGIETTVPIATPEALNAGFTNERGVAGRFRFLKNVMGLWLLERSRGGKSIEECLAMAALQPPTGVRFEVNHATLLNPPDMPSAIRAIADGPLDDDGCLYRCILENLAREYAETIATIERLTGQEIQTVHIVGGGCRNNLLNSLTAAALGRRVLVGPVEATALGNALVQMMGLGAIESVGEARRLVRQSFTCVEAIPEPGSNVRR